MECELPQFYATQEVRAAFVHVCCECNAPIQGGEVHLLCKGKWDGKFNSYRQHLLCARACEYIRSKAWNDYDCIGFGELFNWIGEEFWGFRDIKQKHEADIQEFRNMIAKIRRREHAGI